jgi:hypothetical protein
VEEKAVAAHPGTARATGSTLMFVDESGFSLVPPVRRTWARRGQTPVIRHQSSWPKLSAISGVTPEGRLLLQLVRGSGCHLEFSKHMGWPLGTIGKESWL